MSCGFAWAPKKDEILRAVGDEIRRFLQSEALRREFLNALSERTIEVKMEIRLRPDADVAPRAEVRSSARAGQEGQAEVKRAARLVGPRRGGGGFVPRVLVTQGRVLGTTSPAHPRRPRSRSSCAAAATVRHAEFRGEHPDGADPACGPAHARRVRLSCAAGPRGARAGRILEIDEEGDRAPGGR